MKALLNSPVSLPTPRPNLRGMGLSSYQPMRVVAAAPRASENVSPAKVANVMLLISSLLNVEEAGNFLKDTPRFSSMLQDDLSRLTKLGKEVNVRFLAEFSPEDARHVDTMNKAGNLLKRLALMLLYVPDEVADEAANAAADVIQKHIASSFTS